MDLGHRPGHRGEPHHQSAAAPAGPRRPRLRGQRAPQRRALGQGLQVLPVAGADRRGHPGRLPLRVRLRHHPGRPHPLLGAAHPDPHWYAGIQLGGPVSLEATLSAATDGLRLACLLCCIGAANTLANPKRALRVLPGALYELGVAVTVSMSVAPQLVESVQRVARARRLRADRARGVRAAQHPHPRPRRRPGTLPAPGRRDGQPRIRPRGHRHPRLPPYHRRPHAGRHARPVRRCLRPARREHPARAGTARAPRRIAAVLRRPRPGRPPDPPHQLPPRPVARAGVGGRPVRLRHRRRALPDRRLQRRRPQPGPVPAALALAALAARRRDPARRPRRLRRAAPARTPAAVPAAARQPRKGADTPSEALL